MRTRTRSTLAPLVLALAALSASACSGVTKGKEDAERAATEFHAEFNAGRYDAIWEAAGDELKHGVSRQDFTALLAAIRRKLGDCTGSTTRGWTVSTRNLTTFVTLVQDSAYASGTAAERTGKATETFQFVVRDGRALLVGYDVSSRDLILR